MKKILSVILVLTLILTLAACGSAGASKMTMGTGRSEERRVGKECGR